MAQFKISEGLSAEIKSVETAAVPLGAMIKQLDTKNINTLKTCVKYTKLYMEIGKLLTLYVQLVEKDASDIAKMIAEVKSADDEIGDLY